MEMKTWPEEPINEDDISWSDVVLLEQQAYGGEILDLTGKGMDFVQFELFSIGVTHDFGIVTLRRDFNVRTDEQMEFETQEGQIVLLKVIDESMASAAVFRKGDRVRVFATEFTTGLALRAVCETELLACSDTPEDWDVLPKEIRRYLEERRVVKYRAMS